MREIIIKNEKDTKKFAEELAETLVEGDILALIGDLGTGKTTLTKHLARALGIKEDIKSPTFTILLEHYGGRLPLYHFDLYRLNDVEEVFDLGCEEFFYGDGVSIVEWADRLGMELPLESKIIELKYGENEGERIYICNF